jgi:hypothetical protein
MLAGPVISTVGERDILRSRTSTCAADAGTHLLQGQRLARDTADTRLEAGQMPRVKVRGGITAAPPNPDVVCPQPWTREAVVAAAIDLKVKASFETPTPSRNSRDRHTPESRTSSKYRRYKTQEGGVAKCGRQFCTHSRLHCGWHFILLGSSRSGFLQAGYSDSQKFCRF